MPNDIFSGNRPMAKVRTVSPSPTTAPVSPMTAGGASRAVDPKIELEHFLGEIGRYNEVSKSLTRPSSMREVAQRLMQIAEMAETAVTNEAQDWFDAHTLKRNMKEIKNYAGEFSKMAEESDALNQRMTALYDDIGRILERYFEIPDLMDPEQVPSGEKSDEFGGSLPSDDEPQELTETDGPAVDPDPSIYRATPVPQLDKVDMLTVRAIQLVHKKLKQKNPEMAKQFARLPAQKMKEVVWRLV